MGETVGIVLAAGRSSRMEGFNKLTGPIGGRPMVWYPVWNLRQSGVDRVLVVVGHDRDQVKAALDGSVEWVSQEELLGTGHAAALAIPHVNSADTVVVLFGDCPFLDAQVIRATIATHLERSADLTIATAKLPNPRSLGQIIRGQGGRGVVQRVLDRRVVDADASAYSEVFAGLSVWEAGVFRSVVPNLPLQQLPEGGPEYNLPDAVDLLHSRGKTVASYVLPSERDALAPNDVSEFLDASAYLSVKQRVRLLSCGVQLEDPDTVVVDHGVEVGPSTKIRPRVQLQGSTRVGKNCKIGPDTTLLNCDVGDGCSIGRGTFSDQYFPDGSEAADTLAGDHLYFRRPHSTIPRDPHSCFVVMPFKDPYLAMLNNVIRPVLERCGFACDTAGGPELGPIIDQIWVGINRAQVVVAEVTEDNMNVWYELGLAHALSKQVVMLRKSKPEDVAIPFDIRHQNVLVYDPDKGDLGKRLEAWIAPLVHKVD